MSFIKMGGLTKGIIIDTDDPAGFGRVKVRIPELHGLMDEQSYGTTDLGKDISRRTWISEDKLPWCEVNHPYGSDIVPEPNQVVLVGFIDGSATQPVILGWLGYNYTDKEDVCCVGAIYNTNY